MKKEIAVTGIVLSAVLAFGLSTARATTITYTTSGSNSNGSLEAQADFTTGNGFVDVTLTNLLDAATIRSVGQSVSDITFTLSNPAGAFSTATASGQQGNISSSGVVTYVSGGPDRFLGIGGGNFTVSGSTVTLEAIGGGKPTELIFPLMADGGTYANTNNGITAHNPYTIGPASFVLNLSGVTADTTVTGVTFSFGTGPDTTLSGTPKPPSPVPEPASALALGSSLFALGLFRRRKRT